MRTWGARLCGAVVLMAGAVVFSSGQALACSCAIVPLKQQVSDASGVFIGTVESLAPGKNVTWQVQVDRVYKGDPAETSTVITGQEGANGLVNTCNITLETGREYLFFVEGGADTWTLAACGPPMSPRAEEVSRVRALLGGSAPPTLDQPDPTGTTRAIGAAAGEDASRPWWWLGGGVAALAGVGALALRVHRPRR